MSKERCDRCSKLFKSQEDLVEHRAFAHPAVDFSMLDSELNRVCKVALYEYLSSDGTSKEMHSKAKIAVGHISAEARKEAARNNSISMMIAAATSMTDTRDELKRVMISTFPDLPVVKALSANARS